MDFLLNIVKRHYSKKLETIKSRNISISKNLLI